MESKNEVIKKYLPMIFELDFNIAAPVFLNEWHTMTWDQFQREMTKAGINCDDCKIRDWKRFFVAQRETLNKLEQIE